MRADLSVLDTWATLNASIQTLTEEQVQYLLNHETRHKKRPAWVKRLYHRLSALRREREMKDLGEKIGASIA